MQKMTYKEALKILGCTYLGGIRTSMKIEKSFQKGVCTYAVYLAPSTMARDSAHPHINLCPKSEQCKSFCLNGSGRNKVAILANSSEGSPIQRARIKKTHLLFDNKKLFMWILIHEIKKAKSYAEKNNMEFAVRLNGTSDINPLWLTYERKNILEIFPNVQFYDYTKMPNRLAIPKQYPNYDLTFSYDGTNWDVCEKYLSEGGKVAVVFDVEDEKGKQILPPSYMGYDVEDANETDARFKDRKGTIQGLHYHRVANDYKNGVYSPRETNFVVRDRNYVS